MKLNNFILGSCLVLTLLGLAFGQIPVEPSEYPSQWSIDMLMNSLEPPSPCPSSFTNNWTNPIIAGNLVDSPEHLRRKEIIFNFDAYLANIINSSTGRRICTAAIISPTRLLLDDCDWRTGLKYGGIEARLKCFKRKNDKVTSAFKWVTARIKGVVETIKGSVSFDVASINVEPLLKQCEVFFYHEAMRGQLPVGVTNVERLSTVLIDLIYGSCPDGKRPDETADNDDDGQRDEL